MKRRLLIIGLYIIIGIGGAGSLLAQGLSYKSAELSLSIGETHYWNKPFTIGAPQSTTPIPGGMQLNSGHTYEGRINFYTTRRMGAEAVYGYQYTGVIFSTKAPQPGSFNVPQQIHTVGAELLYYPFGDANSVWRPFVTFGGGALIFRPSSGGQKSAKDPLQGNFDTFFESSRPAGWAGGGVKHPITHSIGFRADAAFLMAKVPTYGLHESSQTPSATVLPVGGLVRDARASVGVIFYLGK